MPSHLGQPRCLMWSWWMRQHRHWSPRHSSPSSLSSQAAGAWCLWVTPASCPPRCSARLPRRPCWRRACLSGWRAQAGQCSCCRSSTGATRQSAPFHPGSSTKASCWMGPASMLSAKVPPSTASWHMGPWWCGTARRAGRGAAAPGGEARCRTQQRQNWRQHWWQVCCQSTSPVSAALPSSPPTGRRWPACAQSSGGSWGETPHWQQQTSSLVRWTASRGGRQTWLSSAACAHNQKLLLPLPLLQLLALAAAAAVAAVRAGRASVSSRMCGA